MKPWFVSFLYRFSKALDNDYYLSKLIGLNVRSQAVSRCSLKICDGQVMAVD